MIVGVNRQDLDGQKAWRALDARQRVVGCSPRTDGRLPDGCCS
jgi:hypothetical protein